MSDELEPDDARRFAPNAGETVPFFTANGTFDLTVGKDVIEVRYRLSLQRQVEARSLGVSPEDTNRPIDLMRIYPERGEVVVTPRMTRADRADFGEDRYYRLHRITLTGLIINDIIWPEQIFGLLEQFPTGLTQHPDFGLAFERRFAPFVRILEQNGVRELVLGDDETQAFYGERYVLPLPTWDRLRRAMDRTHRNALEVASEDKHVLLHNGLMTPIDPDKFPTRVRPYKPDTVFKIVEGVSTSARLSVRDQDATLKAVERHAPDLAKRAPEALLSLEREIRSVTIDTLIAEMEPMLARKSDEAQWQRFFVNHPFVLSLAFGLPATVIDDQVSIGGTGFQRYGERIVDFLCGLGLSDNIAIVEIKTPSTVLLGSLYRQSGKVRPPSPALAGAVAQVQDQREVLTRQFTSQNDTDEPIAERPYAVRCLVVAGRTPKAQGDHRAFELFRNGLTDVLIVTFDELLTKLQALSRFLSGESGRRVKSSALPRRFGSTGVHVNRRSAGRRKSPEKRRPVREADTSIRRSPARPRSQTPRTQ